MKMNFLKKLWREEEGQTMVEYGLLVALIAIVVIAALVILGPKIAEIFTDVGEELDGAGATTPIVGG